MLQIQSVYVDNTFLKENYVVQRRLFQGSQGSVFKIISKRNSKEYAMKVTVNTNTQIQNVDSNCTVLNCAQAEITAYKRIQESTIHLNVLCSSYSPGDEIFNIVSMNSNTTYLILPYCSYDLFEYMKCHYLTTSQRLFMSSCWIYPFPWYCTWRCQIGEYIIAMQRREYIYPQAGGFWIE